MVWSAPAHILVLTREADYHERYRKDDKLQTGDEIEWPVPFWFVDAGTALMLVLLAAIDEGLAAGVYGVPVEEDARWRSYGIPAELRVVAGATVGRPLPDPGWSKVTSRATQRPGRSRSSSAGTDGRTRGLEPSTTIAGDGALPQVPAAGLRRVVGQEAVVRTLRNAIELGQLRQAYLFAGPRGTGKTSMARILAKALNCAAGPTVSPDNVCNACVSIANGTSLDVVEMDAASQRGIDDIREIRERVILQPAEGRYKVYILDEAHQLTDAAWNALLKLIEEPPPHLVFVFCTTDLAKVLPTVRSRCQTFVFARPRLPELVRVLRRIADAEKIEVPDAALALIARGGRGSFRDAVSTLTSSLRQRGTRSTSSRCCSCSEPSRRMPSSASAMRSSTATRPARSRSWRSSRSRARISAGSSSTCSSTCGTCSSSSTWATCPTRCPSPTRRASGCASRRISSQLRPCSGSATCWQSPSRTPGRALTHGCRSSPRS